jgi:hypothetical protein
VSRLEVIREEARDIKKGYSQGNPEYEHLSWVQSVMVEMADLVEEACNIVLDTQNVPQDVPKGA